MFNTNYDTLHISSKPVIFKPSLLYLNSQGERLLLDRDSARSDWTAETRVSY